MSDYIAPFEVVTRTLKKLIEQDVLVNYPGDEQVQVSFDVPDKNFVNSLPEQPVLNLYLYSFQENLERRHGEAFQVTAATANTKTLGRVPRLVDLNYMVSAWSRSQQEKALVEQYLLSRVVQGLGKYTMMPPDMLLEMGYNPGPSGVMMKMLLDQDSKRSQGEFWTALGGHPKPVLNLELTVPVDVHAPLVTPVIENLDTKIERIEPPKDEWDKGIRQMSISGRVILTGGGNYQSVAVHVRSFNSGERWETAPDSQGQYVFEEMSQGEYLIWAVNTDTGVKSAMEEIELSRNDQGQLEPVVLDLTLPG